MTILEPLQWTYCGDFSRNWHEATSAQFVYTVEKNQYGVLEAAVKPVHGHEVIFSSLCVSIENGKQGLEEWRRKQVVQQLSDNARAALALFDL